MKEQMSKGKILIVDDTPQIIQMVSSVLEKEGYLVSAATDSEKAINRAELVKPDLILLDILMPGIDGYETCKQLKSRESIKNIPVIFMSALNETVDKLKGFKLGAVDYITKPIDVAELQARVQAHLTIHLLQRRLQDANTLLEEKVLERTTELAQSNQSLQKEIEEHRKAEEKLQESEAKLRAIFDQTYQLMGLLSLDGILLEANQTALDFVGVDEAEVIGKPFWETGWWSHSPEEQEKLQKAMEKAASGDFVRFETTHPDHSGSIRSFDFSLKPILDADGRVIYLNPEGRDITERKRAEEKLRESETRYRTLFNSAGDGISIIKGDVFDECNYKFSELFGCPLDQINGQTPYKFSPPTQPDGRDSKETTLEKIDKALKGEPQFFEWQHRKFDGTLYDAEITLNCLEIGSEKYLLNIHRDVSERKRAEEARRMSERNYREIFNATSEAIFLHDRETGEILDANETVQDLFGYSDKEVLKLKVADISSGEPDFSQQEALRKIKKAVEEGPQVFDWRCKRKNGEFFWASVSLKNTQIGGQGRVLAVIRDISDRKRSEKALQENESRLNALFNHQFQLTALLNRDGIVLMINQTACNMVGKDSADLVGKYFWELPHWSHSEEVQDRVREGVQQVQQGNDISFETIHPDSKGELHHIDFSMTPIKDEEGNVIFMVPEGHDITERKLAGDEMARLQSLLKNIIDSMPSLLVAVDREGHVTQWNTQAERMTGVSADSAQGRYLPDVIPQLTAGFERFRDTIANRKPLMNTKVPQSVNGETRYQDITIYPLITNGVAGAVIRVDDVTERVRMEEMVIQSEKMLSVGGLAAGMAHEINNPLAGILQNVDLVLRRLTDDIPANLKAAAKCGIDMATIRAYVEKRDIPAYMGDVREAGTRASGIVKNMLSFARMGEGSVSLYEVSELLDRTVEMAASDYNLKKNYDFRLIEVVREYDPGAPKVLCEGSKIQQVFMNILKNGAQAMYETAEGAGHRAKRPRFILRISKADEGVCVEIEDNGPGMDEATRKRVFEPFFSTKAVGMGTGLGLSVSYFIIKENHGGTMAVESRPGDGTKFIINLPLKRK